MIQNCNHTAETMETGSASSHDGIENYVTISQQGGVWHWRRHFADGKLSRTSRQAFASELAAAQAAAVVAGCKGVPLVVAPHLRQSLIMGWQLEGSAFYRQGQPLALCWNEYQREGWRAALAEASQQFHFGWPVAQPVHIESKA